MRVHLNSDFSLHRLCESGVPPVIMLKWHQHHSEDNTNFEINHLKSESFVYAFILFGDILHCGLVAAAWLTVWEGLHGR